MIMFLTYMAVGALLMAMIFKVGKFNEVLPLWYANYTVDCLAKGEEFVSRKTFDNILLAAIFISFLIAWPIPLFIAVRKTIKGKGGK